MLTRLRELRRPQPGRLSPLLRGLGSAVLYIGLCVAYIVISGRLAARYAGSTQQLQTIEAVKGIAFVCVTGVIIFILTYAHWRRIRRQADTILRQEQSLVAGERKVVAAMFAITLAHDLKNLLLSLSGLVAGLQGHAQQDAYLVTLRTDLEHSIDNLSRFATRMASSGSQVLPQEHGRVGVAEVVPRLVALLSRHPDLRKCMIDVGELPAVEVVTNVVLFEEALQNILINAGQATGPGGTILVRALREDDATAIEVHDDGPGVPDEETQTIFEPCFTTKEHGTGVGLLAVKAYVASAGGEVAVGRSHLGGAVFTIRIPDNGHTSGRY